MAKKSDILIAGPWISELGWELMVWQAAVRHRRINGKYEKTYVITYPGREPLYEDCEIIPHEFELKNSPFGLSGFSKKKSESIIREFADKHSINQNYDTFCPSDMLSFSSRLKRKLFGAGLTYQSYKRDDLPKIFDIGFHFRNFDRKDDTSSKNLSNHKADQLAQWASELGLKTCTLGLPNYSYTPPATTNKQSFNLAETIKSINQCKIIVGGSSAPMHLASLCEVPIVVWCPPFVAKRYLSYWNPFNSQVFVTTTQSFDPDIMSIKDKMQEALNDEAIALSA